MESLAKRASLRLKVMSMTKVDLAKKFTQEGLEKCSRTKMSLYLNEKLTGDYKELEQRIEKWMEETEEEAAEIERQEPEKVEGFRMEIEKHFAVSSADTKMKGISAVAAPQVRQKPEVFESDDYINVVGVCSLCQQQQGNAVVVGQSGYGKTFSLRQYARLSRVVYIECNEFVNIRDLIRRLEEQLGLPKRYGSNDERMKQISEFFNINQGYLVIVDEADKLINKHTIRKIEVLRTIRDSSSVGLVLAGQPSLEVFLKAYDDQFANRMDFGYRLHGLSKKEIEQYLEGWSIEDGAMDVLIGRAMNSKNGCFRLFDRTMNNIIRVMQDRKQTVISTKIIDEASAMMML